MDIATRGREWKEKRSKMMIEKKEREKKIKFIGLNISNDFIFET